MARNRRRTRFRTTAPPALRPTAKATRGGWAGSPGTQVTVTGPLRTRRPDRRSDWKVARSRIDQIRPTGADGPCVGERTGWPARPGSTCGGGTHGAWPVCGCSVGTCASLVSSSSRRQAGSARLACRRAPASATSGADQARGRGRAGPNADFPLCRKGVAVLRSGHTRSCGTPSRSFSFPGDLVVPPAHVQPGVVHTCGPRCGQSTGRGGVRASGKGRRPVARVRRRAP